MLSNSLLSSYKSSLNSLGETYQRWKSVRARLADTIQDYVDACNALDLALSHHSGQKSLEQTLVDVDAELSGLEQDCERLTRTDTLPGLSIRNFRLHIST
ncbi:hypothetical protein BDV93DRAFT_554763 [Ceratobasidium sp. AG-I]|nr:hypothetical protein BDV93DRAFT_554763 [Ceratobasidium sp. AG-I]